MTFIDEKDRSQKLSIALNKDTLEVFRADTPAGNRTFHKNPTPSAQGTSSGWAITVNLKKYPPVSRPFSKPLQEFIHPD